MEWVPSRCWVLKVVKQRLEVFLPWEWGGSGEKYEGTVGQMTSSIIFTADILSTCHSLTHTASKMAPVILASEYSCPYVNPSQMESADPSPIGHCGKDGVWLQRLDHRKYCGFCLALLNYSLWSRPAAMSWGHLERPSWKASEVSRQHPAKTCLLCERFTLEADLQSPTSLQMTTSPDDI